MYTSGAGNRNRRLRLYAFMLEGISDEMKIQITAKLVQEVLSHALDFSQSLLEDSPYTNAIHDALLILQVNSF